VESSNSNIRFRYIMMSSTYCSVRLVNTSSRSSTREGSRETKVVIVGHEARSRALMLSINPAGLLLQENWLMIVLLGLSPATRRSWITPSAVSNGEVGMISHL